MGTTTGRATHPAWRWPATGTTWHVHHSGGVDAAAAQAAAELVERDEARWSRFRPSSDVSRINRNAGRAVHVDAETMRLLAECRRWVERTEGVFQPLVGAVLKSWGYRDSMLERPAGTVSSPRDRPVTGAIELDTASSTARIPPHVQLDLGGIAKSWIAQRLADLLAARCDDDTILVDAGGDLASARGDHIVAVERPGMSLPNRPGLSAGETAVRVVIGEGEGIATSGCGRRSWVNGDGHDAHHLIDPIAGRPGPRTQATVIADDVVTADVIAKTLALRPRLIGRAVEMAMITAGPLSHSTPAWDWRVVS
jgi:thiamine biosynthesis lipoprotein